MPASVGSLVRGDILISNFNDSENLQGTGTTIVQLTPGGQLSLFAQIESAALQPCPGGVGLTTALAILPGGVRRRRQPARRRNGSAGDREGRRA